MTRIILAVALAFVSICSLITVDSRVLAAQTLRKVNNRKPVQANRSFEASQIDPSIPSVFETLSDYFPIGAAIWQGDVTGDHSDLLKKHFNSITAENDMKPGPLQPTEGVFNFTAADSLVTFARSNNIRVRGHTLVWHNQNPSWLFKDASGNSLQPTPQNKTLMLQRLENHIRSVVTHFKDDVYAWDVVNEVIDPSQSDGFRRSQWFQLTGTDYIDRAFQVAHEVAPNAKLFINDYDTTNPTKRTFLLNLIRDLKNRGVPVDGIGHQMHSNISFPSVTAITDTINMFADLGVDNQITELDMSIYTDSTSSYSVVPEDILVKQGYLYRDFFQAFRKLKGKISGVTFWGEADDHTWLSTFPITRLEMPLLFDQQLQAKHAYWGVVDPLRLPGSDLKLSAISDSNTAARGKSLTHTFTVTNNGPDPAASLSFVDNIPNGLLFQSLVSPNGWSCNAPQIGSSGQITCTSSSLAVGAPIQFSVTVATSCSATGGAQITNSAVVASTSRNPNPTPVNTDSVKLLVIDTPPIINGLSVDKPVLTPANNQMVDVTLSYSTSDSCGGAIVPAIIVRSKQVPGNNNSQQNWEIVDDHHIRLRASLIGYTNNGQTSYATLTYIITVTVVNSVSLSSSDSVSVSVPATQKTLAGPRVPGNRPLVTPPRPIQSGSSRLMPGSKP